MADPEFERIVDRDLDEGRHVNPTRTPGWLTTVDEWLDDPDRRAALLRAIRWVEAEPSLLGAGAHVLAVGVRP